MKQSLPYLLFRTTGFYRQAGIFLTLVTVLGSAFLIRSFNASTPPPGYKDMWISKAELDSIPMSGPGWTRLKEDADGSWGTAEVGEEQNHHDAYTMAGALVFARLYPDSAAETYRKRVADALMSAIGTETSSSQRWKGVARNLSAYVIAADLINFPAYDAEREAIWRRWISGLRTTEIGGRSLNWTNENRPQNHGTMAGASRIAINIYLGDKSDLDKAADVFHGWLGNRSVHTFPDGQYPDITSWQCDPSAQTGINAEGCTKEGINIDGVIAPELTRGGGFAIPPGKTIYIWFGYGHGGLVQTELLERQGYPAKSWENSAIRRAAEWIWYAEQQWGGWWKSKGIPARQFPYLINYLYGTDYPTFSGSGHGHNIGWIEFTHAGRTSANAKPRFSRW